jgi:hypothetical protein
VLDSSRPIDFPPTWAHHNSHHITAHFRCSPFHTTYSTPLPFTAQHSAPHPTLHHQPTCQQLETHSQCTHRQLLGNSEPTTISTTQHKQSPPTSHNHPNRTQMWLDSPNHPNRTQMWLGSPNHPNRTPMRLGSPSPSNPPTPLAVSTLSHHLPTNPVLVGHHYAPQHWPTP